MCAGADAAFGAWRAAENGPKPRILILAPRAHTLHWYRRAKAWHGGAAGVLPVRVLRGDVALRPGTLLEEAKGKPGVCLVLGALEALLASEAEAGAKGALPRVLDPPCRVGPRGRRRHRRRPQSAGADDDDSDHEVCAVPGDDASPARAEPAWDLAIVDAADKSATPSGSAALVAAFGALGGAGGARGWALLRDRPCDELHVTSASRVRREADGGGRCALLAQPHTAEGAGEVMQRKRRKRRASALNVQLQKNLPAKRRA